MLVAHLAVDPAGLDQAGLQPVASEAKADEHRVVALFRARVFERFRSVPLRIVLCFVPVTASPAVTG